MKRSRQGDGAISANIGSYRPQLLLPSARVLAAGTATTGPSTFRMAIKETIVSGRTYRFAPAECFGPRIATLHNVWAALLLALLMLLPTGIAEGAARKSHPYRTRWKHATVGKGADAAPHMYSIQVKLTPDGRWVDVNSTNAPYECVSCARLLVSNMCPSTKDGWRYGYPCVGQGRGRCAGVPATQGRTNDRLRVRIVDATGRTIWLAD